jgi:hypothetical protein
MLAAINLDKPVQIIIERGFRFHPFDLCAWRALPVPVADLRRELDALDLGDLCKRARAERVNNALIDEALNQPDPTAAVVDAIVSQHESADQLWGDADEDTKAKITRMIDDNLPDAITYRRRDYEADAMMREICVRNGTRLPTRFQMPPESLPHWNSSNVRTLSVFVLYHQDTGSALLRELQVEVAQLTQGRVTFTEAPEEREAADRVLLILTAGVLSSHRPDSAGSAASLQCLEEVIAIDKLTRTDRIVAIYSTEQGWEFNCAEQKAASAEVQQCLSDHEAVEFRPKDPVEDSAGDRHEFSVMTKHLVDNLYRPVKRDVARGSQPEPEPEPEPEPDVPEGVPRLGRRLSSG